MPSRTPSTKVTRRVRTAGTRAPGMITPTRLSGSVAFSGDPFALLGARRTWVSCSWAAGQRVLLAAEPADEAPAPHEPTVFEPPQRPLQVAPGEPQRVVHDEVAEQHAPPVQQQLGDGLGQLVAVGGGEIGERDRLGSGHQ